MGITLGIVLVAVAFGGWRILLPVDGGGSSGVGEGVSSMLSTVVKAQFTGAQASLDAQRTATGSYAGAVVQAPIVLVRADGGSYCLQLAQGPELQHLAGPGGAPAAGPC